MGSTGIYIKRKGFKDDLTWQLSVQALACSATTRQRAVVIETTLLAVRRRHPHLRMSDLRIIGQLTRAANKLLTT